MEAPKKRSAKLEVKGESVDFKELLRIEPDSGVTNIRNTSRSIGVGGSAPRTAVWSRYVVFRIRHDRRQEGARLVCYQREPTMLAFAGIWTNWTCARNAKEGKITADVASFAAALTNGSVCSAAHHAYALTATTIDPARWS